MGFPDTKAGAEEAERQEIHRVRTTGEVKPTPPPEDKKEVPTVLEFSTHFLDVARQVNKFTAVGDKERALRNHILPRLGSLRIDQISYADIEDFRLGLSSVRKVKALSPKATSVPKVKPLSPKTMNNIMMVLHRMLVIAKKRGLRDSVPEFEWLRVAIQEFDFLTYDEAERLAKATAPDWRAMVQVALRTGMRRGELLALRWQDVDLSAGRLVVRQNAVDGIIGTPKSGKAREIPLSKATVAVFQEHRHLRGPLVFCDRDGSLISHKRVQRPLTHACQRAGLRHLGWHVLRHTFASHLAMRGAPLKVIQEMLGHANVQMTMRYAHLAPEVARDAIQLLDLSSVAA